MNPTISNRAIDVRIRTVEELLSNHLPHKLQRLTEKFRLRQPPLIVSEEDILQFTNEIEKGLETKLPEIAERVEAQKQASLRGILSRGKTEVLLEGKPRELNLDDKMAYFGPRMEKYEITIGESLVEKPLAHEATQLLDNYIEEVLHRIDHGGFPADIPIADALETLCRYAQNILTTAKVYSTGNGKIEDKHMNDAIVYLDTRCALNSTLTSVLQEYSNRP
jgi:hypothetical protein